MSGKNSSDSPDDETANLFSRAYLRPPIAQRDSLRFRTRVFAAYWTGYGLDHERFRLVVERELGVRIPERYEAYHRAFFEKGELRDVLDALTIVYRMVSAPAHWLQFVRRVLHEEALGYVINDAGAVRFLVDQEFERTRFATIEGLGSPRFAAVRKAVEDAFAKLDGEPLDTKGAVRGMFEAVETLCKLLGDHNEDLDERMIQRRIKPMVAKAYETDRSAQSFAEQTAHGLVQWVNAGHKYRHGQKTEEPRDPPLELAISFLSAGAGHIRLLVALASKAAPTVKD